VKLWDGGMSFHGGVIGTSIGIMYLACKEKLQWLRLHDYVACVVPIGLLPGGWRTSSTPSCGARRLPCRGRCAFPR
jgi:prolipoprotein diacylglyceryltransferase